MNDKQKLQLRGVGIIVILLCVWSIQSFFFLRWQILINSTIGQPLLHTRVSELLIANGIPSNQVDSCLRWAFGDDIGHAQLREFDERWRKIHPDLFVMKGSDSVDYALGMVAKEYLNRK